MGWNYRHFQASWWSFDVAVMGHDKGQFLRDWIVHYIDVTVTTMASQITSHKKTSKLRVTGLCVGNSPGPVNAPHKGPVTRKMFPFDDVIMPKRGGDDTHILWMLSIKHRAWHLRWRMMDWVLQTFPHMETCVKRKIFFKLSYRTYDGLTSVWIIHW